MVPPTAAAAAAAGYSLRNSSPRITQEVAFAADMRPSSAVFTSARARQRPFEGSGGCTDTSSRIVCFFRFDLNASIRNSFSPFICIFEARAVKRAHRGYLQCHRLSSSPMPAALVPSSGRRREVLYAPLHGALLGSCAGAPQNIPPLET